jgi:hypothetical protein
MVQAGTPAPSYFEFVSSCVYDEDDPERARFDDYDAIAHEEIIVSAPSGINLYHPRR